MNLLLVQGVLTVFLVFALSRVILRFRDGSIKSTEFFFWSALFTIAIVAVVLPGETTHFAALLGIGRGVDLIVYASVAVLFYLVFRLYVLIENLRHDITEIVRLFGLKNLK